MSFPPSPNPSTTHGPDRAALRYRLAAIVYDALIVGAIWIFTIVVLVTASGSAVLGPWVQSLLFIELYGFFAYFWTQRGQTLGMLAWRLRIVSDGPFTFRQALLRFIGATLSFLSLGIGYFWAWFDRDGRTWPDILSSSRVVRVPKPAR